MTPEHYSGAAFGWFVMIVFMMPSADLFVGLSQGYVFISQVGYDSTCSSALHQCLT